MNKNSTTPPKNKKPQKNKLPKSFSIVDLASYERNITERKQYEEEIKEREEKYQLLIDIFRNAIRITWQNRIPKRNRIISIDKLSLTMN